MRHHHSLGIPTGYITNPAANTSAVWTAPSPLIVVAVAVSLTCSATVQNRGMRLEVATLGEVLFYAGTPAALTANQAVLWSLSPSGGSALNYVDPAAASNLVVVSSSMPEIPLGPPPPALSQVTAYIDNGAATDQLNLTVFAVPN